MAEHLAAFPVGRRIDRAGRPLRGLDLSRLAFTGGDRHGANLSGTNLFAAKFQGANLVGANLSGAAMGTERHETVRDTVRHDEVVVEQARHGIPASRREAEAAQQDSKLVPLHSGFDRLAPEAARSGKLR